MISLYPDAPGWMSYTPTTGAVTLGNGTLTGRYKVIPGLVFFTIRLVFGTTTAFTGQPTFSPPVSVHSAWTNRINQNTVLATYADATGGTAHGACDLSGGVFYPYVNNVGGTYEADANISATIPFPWATNDQLAISGWYQPA